MGGTPDFGDACTGIAGKRSHEQLQERSDDAPSAKLLHQGEGAVSFV